MDRGSMMRPPQRLEPRGVASQQEVLSMLVLTREKGQKLLIGDGIVITVLQFRGDRVRLGIEAPKDMPVDREEVRKSKDKEKQDGNE